MPKVKMPRSAPSLDMTPLVDLAFLLVTFFILTSSFRQPEPVTVDVPTSTNDSLIPKSSFVITIDADGRTFMDITFPAIKGKVFMKMCEKKGIKPTAQDSVKFTGTSSIGMKVKDIAEYLSMEPGERNKFEMKGIPYDTTKPSTESELYWWAYYANKASRIDFEERKAKAEQAKQPFDPRTKLQFAVKADAKTKYDVVQAVIKIFRDAKIKEFQMITGLEDKPRT